MTPYFASLMRFIDSSTLVTSFELGSKVLNCPVLTRPAVSWPLSIVVGCAATLIMFGGAMELPPETELSVPMRFSRAPCAPACQMPYIGLCGFVLVSFCESAGTMVPVTLAMAAVLVNFVLMPRICALSE